MDYSMDNRDDVAKLARSLNPLMDDLERIFRGKFNEENLPFQYFTLSSELDGSFQPKSTLKLTTSLDNIKGIQPISLSITPTSAPWVVYEQNGSNITIKKILGVPANTPFSITIRIES